MFQFNILFDHRRRRRGDKREDKPPAISNLSLAPLKDIPEDAPEKLRLLKAEAFVQSWARRDSGHVRPGLPDTLPL